MKVLARLFWEFSKISLFVIGGGYAIIAVADQAFSRKKWTEDGELLDQLPVFQMIPGLIATHTAVYVGRKIAGCVGAAVGVLAVAWPSVVIFTLVAAGYDSLPLGNAFVESAFVGLRSALTGIIAAAVVRGWSRSLRDAFAYCVMFVSVVVLSLGVEVWIVLVSAMAIGLGMAAGERRMQASLLPILLFLKYGALCFGGGFVLVPMYIEDFVGPSAAFLQVTAEEFSNLMALTQMTPGPIGVNGATYFGFRIAGVPGAVAASAALLLPGSFLAYFAFASLDRFRTSQMVQGILRGVRPASVALMLVALAAFARMSVFGGMTNFNITAAILGIISAVMTLKRKLNPVLLVVASAILAGAVRAEDEVTAERYPDADAVVVDSVTCVAYRPDGTYEETSESWTKILTEKGRKSESTITLEYSKRYGEAAILYVGAIGTDGNERQIDVSATSREATDNSSMNSNIYDPLSRKIVCTVPGLKIGETVHAKTLRRAHKARCEGEWADISVFEWTQPILRGRWEITAPGELPLKSIAVRNPLGNVTSSSTAMQDGSILHVFSCTNSAQVFPEPNMPPLYTQVQHVRVSTLSDWPEVSRWYWNLCRSHLAKTSPVMTNKVLEITRGMSSDDERLRAVFKFVSQEIRYMGLTMEDTSPGYAPHDVDVTFDNRYGVCRDKAGLLVSLLRIAGFDAYPVLINIGAKMDPEVPQPFFNHAIVAVERNPGEYVLMDPTDENAKDMFPSYESDKSYLVCRPEGETLRTSPVESAARNSLAIKSKGILAKDGSLYLENDLMFSGINDTIYRHALVKKTPEDRIKFFERIVKGLATGAELVKCEIEPDDMRDTDRPIKVRLASRLPDVLIRGENLDRLSIPYISAKLGMVNLLLEGNTSLEKRKYPLEVYTTASFDEQIAVFLRGAVGEPEEVPRDEKIAVGNSYEYVRTCSVEDGVLTSRRSMTISKVEFSPEEYTQLREGIKMVERDGRRQPAFAKDVCADADVRHLLEATDVGISSDHAWIVTNRVEREILTYDGKKRSAELKFSFNPAVEGIELVYASISNRNGSVVSISNKEINFMDCGWVASAPRYPASRLLVANLPAVEIGSVISYMVVRSVTNAPVSYYGVFGFDSHKPILRRHVRVNDWARDVISPPRVPNEAGQPFASLWRDQVIISSNKFERVDLCVAPYRGDISFIGASPTPKNIRDWMAKHIKVVGPGLYELPLELQLTNPVTIIRERYATRLDYVRTMCAILKAAGYDADVVLAADNAGEPEQIRSRMKFEKPNVRAFSFALCRVREKTGGVFGIGGDVKEYFIGTENEYAPLGASGYAGSDYFDPLKCEFGVVALPDENLRDASAETVEMDVRDNGGVDITMENLIWGIDVAMFRKRYSEILPEDRSRLYQSILGSVSQAATATSELEADVDGYPARRRFSCFVPDYAIVDGDIITLQLPALASSIPTFTGRARRTPFAVDEADRESERVTIHFPDGYTEIEHMPESFVFADPYDRNCMWVESRTESRIVDGRLVVEICREVHERPYSWYPPDFVELIRDRNRIAGSRANRTIVVRRRTACELDGRKQ